MTNEDKKKKNLAHRRFPPSKEMILIAPNKLNRQVAKYAKEGRSQQ
jgi:hypothetical protein